MIRRGDKELVNRKNVRSGAVIHLSRDFLLSTMESDVRAISIRDRVTGKRFGSLLLGDDLLIFLC